MTVKSKRHDLFDYIGSVEKEIADEYERIQKRVKEDPGTAGDQGEENWAEILRGWLPSTYYVVTRGRIIGHNNEVSDQIDILVLKPAYPSSLRAKKLYLAGGVAAAFECKLTLHPEHIDQAMQHSAKIKALYPERKGSPYKELHTPIIYGLLAHSHDWKKENSKPMENVSNNLRLAHNAAYLNHPRKLLDVLCVTDLACWTLSMFPYHGPCLYTDMGKLNPDISPDVLKILKEEWKKEYATTMYMVFGGLSDPQQKIRYAPIGVLIGDLLTRLAWEDINRRGMADYYRLTNLHGNGSGWDRQWPLSIYSEKVRSRLQMGRLTQNVPWDEWSLHF